MGERNVKFQSGKESLRGSLFIPSDKGLLPAVIFYHGGGSSRIRYLPIAEQLAKEGILTFAFDFRGCGQSNGVFERQTHKDGIDDATVALQFLLSQSVDKARIGLCGSSSGAYVIGMILPQFPFIKSILLRSPAAYSDRFLQATGYQEKDFFDNKENWEDSSVYKNIRDFKGAVLVLRCGSDELIPKELVKKYYEEALSARERKLAVLAGADHALSKPAHLEDFYQKTYDWFLKTL